MKKVYILFGGWEYEESRVLSVFTDKEKAYKELEEERLKKDYGHYFMEDHEIKKEVTPFIKNPSYDDILNLNEELKNE